MKALLIGAGAVGQVYGYHLQRGGAEVSFLVKEKYAAAARAGFTVYALNEGRRPQRFEGFGVLTRFEEVAAERWDQVWLCVPSTALEGQWIAGLLESIGAATLVDLTPGVADAPHRRLPRERLVDGMINLISYQAPLEGETLPEPGVAWWFPPLQSSPFAGPEANAVVRALTAGGCPAKVDGGARAQGRFGAAVLMPWIVGLERGGWSFDGFTRSRWIRLADRAAREASAAVGAADGQRPPAALRLIGPAAGRAALWLAPKVTPLPLEIYLRYHFTKVGPQTREMMVDYIALADANGLPSAALRELMEGL